MKIIKKITNFVLSLFNRQLCHDCATIITKDDCLCYPCDVKLAEEIEKIKEEYVTIWEEEETIPMEDKKEFFERCKKHDWFFDYSDDVVVWKRGAEEDKKLCLLAKAFPELKTIHNAFIQSRNMQHADPLPSAFGIV